MKREESKEARSCVNEEKLDFFAKFSEFVLSYSNSRRHQCYYSNASKKKYAIFRLSTDDTKDRTIVVLINTFETSAKNRHITNDKRIALSIVDQNNPFNTASIKGKVIEQTTEEADEHLKRLAKKYLGIGKYQYRKPSQ